MSHDGKRPVTLEDLLRLKRAERPAPEFWEQFDRELRVKQLAALVEKRPWWRDVPPMFTAWKRFHLPLGAAAVLAVSFVTMHDFTSATAGSSSVASTKPASTAVLAPASPTVATDAGAAALDSESTVALPANNVAENVGAAETAADAESSTPAGTSRVLPLLAGTLDASPTTAEASPSARSIAANLAAVEAAAPVMVGGLLGRARSFESRGLVTRAVAVEPLQQMTPPSEVRLARYRSPLVAMTAEEADRTGERIARRISGDRLYEQIGRISGRGDRVNLKF